MIDWSAIDTVLLDMDGTLLDLHFDNFFWMTYLPRKYAEHHGLHADEASRKLHGLYQEKKGTLDWYCLDFWSEHLAVDIRALKEEVQHLIRERPHALRFLRALKDSGKRRILITNAHPKSLELKLSLTGIERELDEIISSHTFGHPKESSLFWRHLQSHTSFAPERTLFIDDSIPILRTAYAFGVRYLLAICQPDSALSPISTEGFAAIDHFDEILPPPTITADSGRG